MIKEKQSILTIPDLHGGTFWKKAVRGHENYRIVFLGDYLDPYDDHYGIYGQKDDFRPEAVIENFKEILELKRSAPERVTLLLGEHDCGYLYGRNVCDCRCDYENYNLIQGLFRDNKDLFQLAEETCRGGKHFVFVHAGLFRGWMDRYVKGWTPENMVRELNRLNAQALAAPHPEKMPFAEALSPDAEFASPVCIDALGLHDGVQITEAVQIVGHTPVLKMNRPAALTPNAWYIDCRQGFILDSLGTLRYLDGTRCVNDEDPFRPKSDHFRGTRFGMDWFARPFCHECGSHQVRIDFTMFFDHWKCLECDNSGYLWCNRLEGKDPDYSNYNN